MNGNGNSKNGNGNGYGKRCPACTKPILEWEAACSACWATLKTHDAMHGTHYIEDVLAGRKPEFEMKDDLKDQLKWFKNMRKVELKDICVELCRRCVVPESTGASVAGNDPCFKCEWKKKMDRLMSEYEWD